MTFKAAPATTAEPSASWYSRLYVQVLIAILLGAILGYVYPTVGESMKPLGDALIKMIKMTIAPLVFCMVVHGLASMRDMKKVGRVGLKSLIYFEVVTTLALITGLIVINLWRPGVGMNVDPATLDAKLVAGYVTRAHDQSTVSFLLDIIPNTFVGAFANGEMLQVLFLAIFFALSLQLLLQLLMPRRSSSAAIARSG